MQDLMKQPDDVPRRREHHQAVVGVQPLAVPGAHLTQPLHIQTRIVQNRGVVQQKGLALKSLQTLQTGDPMSREHLAMRHLRMVEHARGAHQRRPPDQLTRNRPMRTRRREVKRPPQPIVQPPVAQKYARRRSTHPTDPPWPPPIRHHPAGRKRHIMQQAEMCANLRLHGRGSVMHRNRPAAGPQGRRLQRDDPQPAIEPGVQ
ncbi:MAG: hypothetical protein FLDDKLPJ_00634 [Phycisphaerae bacterium]|nr:hypothetical protein [Phycisphaerae bacterium]